MSKALNASRQITRHPREIEREIESHRTFLEHLRKLAAEFAAVDMRPFYWHDGQITYTRELNIPAELLTMMRSEAQTIADLQAEYCN